MSKKEIVQFVNRPKKRTTAYSGNFIAANDVPKYKAVALPKKAADPLDVIRVHVPVPDDPVAQAGDQARARMQERRQVFDPPPEYAGQASADLGDFDDGPEDEPYDPDASLKRQLQAGQAQDNKYVFGEYTSSSSSKKKTKKPKKTKNCSCGRSVVSCGTSLYQCCSCGKTFCSNNLSHDKEGRETHIVLQGDSGNGSAGYIECGLAIRIHKNSISRIKITTES